MRDRAGSSRSFVKNSAGQLNVVININSIKDMEYVEKVRNEVNHLVEEGVKICDEVYAKVEKALGK